MAENKKTKDYKKLSQIKSVIFLVLAVLFLTGMFRNGKGTPETAETEAALTQTAVEDKSSETIPEEVLKQIAESSCGAVQNAKKEEETVALLVTETGTYTDKEHVALYIHNYKKLPSNFITKTQAKKKGWDPETGNLQEVLPGMSIGGGEFRNEEGKLPEKDGRTWNECDIGYEGGERGPERIVYSDDGLIYYTGDHYNTFECLYGQEE